MRSFGSLLMLFPIFVLAIAFPLISFIYPFATIWNWFMVPFFGLPEMTYSMTLIICLLKNLLFMNEDIKDEKKKDKDVEIIVLSRIIYPWFVLLIAWFVYIHWPVVSASSQTSQTNSSLVISNSEIIIEK